MNSGLNHTIHTILGVLSRTDSDRTDANIGTAEARQEIFYSHAFGHWIYPKNNDFKVRDYQRDIAQTGFSFAHVYTFVYSHVYWI